MTMTRNLAAIVLVLFLSLLCGCTQPAATVAYRPGYFTEKADVFIVRPFAATFDDAQKDSDLLPNWIVKIRPEPQTEADIKAGWIASIALSEQIVATLNARGFPAVLASKGQAVTPKTGIILGQFVNQASGHDNLRPSIGYRAGKPVETRVQLVQKNEFIGELKIHAHDKDDAKQAATSIARQIADVLEQAYIKNGWMAAPITK